MEVPQDLFVMKLLDQVVQLRHQLLVLQHKVPAADKVNSLTNDQVGVNEDFRHLTSKLDKRALGLRQRDLVLFMIVFEGLDVGQPLEPVGKFMKSVLIVENVLIFENVEPFKASLLQFWRLHRRLAPLEVVDEHESVT